VPRDDQLAIGQQRNPTPPLVASPPAEVPGSGGGEVGRVDGTGGGAKAKIPVPGSNPMAATMSRGSQHR